MDQGTTYEMGTLISPRDGALLGEGHTGKCSDMPAVDILNLFTGAAVYCSSLYHELLAADLLPDVAGDRAVDAVWPECVSAGARRQDEKTASQLRPAHPRDAARGRAADEAQPRRRLARAEPLHGRGPTQNHQRQVSFSFSSLSPSSLSLCD